jgi:hypothetical protein
MPLPFPGMDPYLEHRWPSVHSRLIVELADFLTPQLLPKYFVDIEERIYLTAGEERVALIPDVTVKRDTSNPNASANVAVATMTEPTAVRVPMLEEVKRNYIEIKEAASKEVVTAIEVLSPTNKRPGKGREQYDRKRQQIFNSRTHLVEIDLLRNWEPMQLFDCNLKTDYRILVSRQQQRPQAALYGFKLQNQIPLFPVPLQPRDTEPAIDLHDLLNKIYDRARYDLKVDYSRSPAPRLSRKDESLKTTGFNCADSKRTGDFSRRGR